jgi:hypothetical protein
MEMKTASINNTLSLEMCERKWRKEKQLKENMGQGGLVKSRKV